MISILKIALKYLTYAQPGTYWPSDISKMVYAFFRDCRRNTMEQDLVQITDDILNDLFQNRLSEQDKLALENWIRTQLEHERRCWKDKLKLSFLEVEKERKLALKAHAGVHVVSEHVESLMAKYEFEISEEYAPADIDNKVSHINSLYRNIDAILHLLSRLVKDRQACLQYLGHDVLSQDPLFPIVAVSFDELKQTIQDTITQSSIKEEDLRTQVSKLREQLDMSQYENTNSDCTHKISADNIDMEMCVKGDNKSPDMVEDKYKKDGDGSKTMTSSCLVDVGVQVSLGEIREQTITNWPGQLEDRQLSIIGNGPENGGVTHKHHNKSSATSSGSSENEPDVTRTMPANQLQTRLLILPRTPTGLQKGGMTPGTPLAQAHKAKHEVRMSNLRKAASEDSFYLTMATKPRRGLRRPRVMHEYERYSDGYLSGVRKEIINSTATSHTQTHSTKPVLWRRTGDSKGIYNVGNRCLRCHKLYGAKDNHRMACRYHPKGKRKIEKYDARGRLSMVTYIWECCMQRPEATGCSTGEHV